MLAALSKKTEEKKFTRAHLSHPESSSGAEPGDRAALGVPLFLQPKLAISQPGDLYEQEADRVENQIMRMPEPVVQRQCAVWTASDLFRLACEEESVKVSRKARGKLANDVSPLVHSVLSSPGQPLSASTRAFFEPRFGQDFSQVRVHADREAQQSARDVNALAYTVGSHVVFGDGRYAPGTSDGQRLLAHELAHVMQVSEHRASEGTTAGRTLPILRQSADKVEDARREALASLDWLAAYPPIIFDDNAPVLIAWARQQAAEFQDPATTDQKRHYLAQGLLRVHKQLQGFEGRAKRNPQGALVYTDILRNTQTPWTEVGARSLDAIDPFTPPNIGEWKIAAKSARAAVRLGEQKAAEKEKSQKQVAERPEPRRDAEKVTFRKKKGMTFKTVEGQQQIAFFLMATIQPLSSINELAWAVSQIDLSKWWAPPTGGDLPTWQQEFEATDVDNEFTMVVSGKFIAEVGALMMRGPKERDFMVEAVRRGVVESKYGLYLGVGTFVVGASALTGGAFLGTMLAPGGALATGGVLSGGGLLGGGIGQSARAVGGYLFLNTPQLYGSAMLYGGAVLSGIALGEHVRQIRSEGWQGWRREVPQFVGDVLPLAGGYSEYLSFRGGSGGQKPEESPPVGGGGGGASGSGGGGGGRQTIQSSPPPMPSNPAAAKPPASTLRASPPPPPTRTSGGGPDAVNDVDLVKANISAPSSIKPQDPGLHQADWNARGGSGTALPAYRDGDGNIRVSTDHPLLRPITNPSIPPPPGALRQGPYVFTQNRFGGPVPPPSEGRVKPPPQTRTSRAHELGLADTGQAPPSVPAQGDIGRADTGQAPAQPAPAPAAPVRPGANTGTAGGATRAPQASSARPGPQAISPEGVERIRNLPPRAAPGVPVRKGAGNNVLYSADHEAHNLAWRQLGGYGEEAPPAFIYDGQVYLDPSRWPPGR